MEEQPTQVNQGIDITNLLGALAKKYGNGRLEVSKSDLAKINQSEVRVADNGDFITVAILDQVEWLRFQANQMTSEANALESKKKQDALDAQQKLEAEFLRVAQKIGEASQGV